MAENRVQGTDRVVLALLGVSLTANVILGTLVFRTPRPASGAPTIALGTQVSAVAGKDLAGGVSTISLVGRGTTIVYAFTASCPWCKRNLPNLRALSRIGEGDVHIVALALESDPAVVKSYISEYRFPVADVILPDTKTRNLLRLGPVPETLVFNRQGRLQHVWQGAYTSVVADEMKKRFGVELPGLAEAPDSPEVKGSN